MFWDFIVSGGEKTEVSGGDGELPAMVQGLIQERKEWSVIKARYWLSEKKILNDRTYLLQKISENLSFSSRGS